LELAGLRGDVAFLSAEYQLSERTACKLLGVERSSYRYEPRADRNAALRDELVKLARQKPRYGYRRLHALLSRRGHKVNVKRVYRLYVEERLMVRRRRRKRLVRERTAEPRLTGANRDFIVDGHLTHDPSDRTSVLHYRHSRHARLLQRQAWLRVSGDVARSAGLRHRGARPARDSFPLRQAAHSNPDKYADELLDAYLFVEDADALHAEYAANSVEFTRELADTPWHSREFVVKDCDGRLLAFGSNL
jgi:HTH-like domain